MREPLHLVAQLEAPRERHEQILADFVTPFARDLRGAPELRTFTFGRAAEPVWQVRLAIAGRADWIAGPVRERLERDLEALLAAGLIDAADFVPPVSPDTERYGGETGRALAEELAFHDSLACLDLMAAERQGLCRRTRRELALLMTERLLHLLRFNRAQRLAFYAFGFRWTREEGEWSGGDLAALEKRYQDLKPSLQRLFAAERDPAAEWGGAEPARIAARFLDAARPVADAIRDGLAAGRIRQEPVYLAWSCAHGQCNRLGIEATPEALLRYFMHRLAQDAEGGSGLP